MEYNITFFYYIISSTIKLKFVKMPKCNSCKKKCGLLVFTCSACGKEHCVTHQLPECHNCSEIQKVKDESNKVLQHTIMKTLEASSTKKNYVQM